MKRLTDVFYSSVMIVFLLIANHLVGQDIRKNAQYKEYLAKGGVMIPEDAKWYNHNRSFSVFDLQGQYAVFNFWNPAAPDASAVIQQVNNVHATNGAFIGLTVLTTENNRSFSPEEVHHYIREHSINHPVIVTTEREPFNIDSKFFEDLPFLALVDGTARRQVNLNSENINLLEEIVAQVAEEEGLTNSNRRDLFSKAPERTGLRYALDFPADLFADVGGNRLIIAEPNANQIIETDLNGAIRKVYGTGAAGYRDGSAGSAQFNRPGRIAYDRAANKLYVIDQGNNRVRSVNLEDGQVSTVLGNGAVAKETVLNVDSTDTAIPFASDLTFTNGKLYIAMPKVNQIWEYDPSKGTARAAFGNGNRASLDGAAGLAAFNQPFRLTHHSSGELLTLDYGTMTVRQISIDGAVKTLTTMCSESDENAFNDIAVINEQVFLSSSSAHGVFVLEDEACELLTGGQYGSETGRAKKVKLREPVVLSGTQEDLYMIDVHSHKLLNANASNGKVREIELSGINKLFENAVAFVDGDRIKLEERYVKNGVSSIYVNVELGKDFEFVESGRNEIRMDAPRQNRLLTSDPTRGFIEFEASGIGEHNNVLIQYYSTVRHKPTGVVMFWPVLLHFPLMIDDEMGSSSHDLTWKPFEGFTP